MATKTKSPAPGKGRGRKTAAPKAKSPTAKAEKSKKSSKSSKSKASPPVYGSRGRPTSYKPEYAAIARKMCSMGATDADLAEAFGVQTVTIWRWSTANPEFCSALKVEKGEFDDRVERSLAQRAVGYSYDAVKVFMPSGADAPVYAPYVEHVPPDPGACKLWLTNRRRAEWSDTSKLEHTGKDGAPLNPVDASPRELARAVLDLLREARMADVQG